MTSFENACTLIAGEISAPFPRTISGRPLPQGSPSMPNSAQKVRPNNSQSDTFSVCSRRRTKMPIIYPDLRLAYKVATHPTFWKMTVFLKPPSASPATPIAVPRSSMIAAARRFCSKTWKGFVPNLDSAERVRNAARPSLYQLYYSYEDTKWVEDLEKHLKPYLRAGSQPSQNAEATNVWACRHRIAPRSPTTRAAFSGP